MFTNYSLEHHNNRHPKLLIKTIQHFAIHDKSIVSCWIPFGIFFFCKRVCSAKKKESGEQIGLEKSPGGEQYFFRKFPLYHYECDVCSTNYPNENGTLSQYEFELNHLSTTHQQDVDVHRDIIFLRVEKNELSKIIYHLIIWHRPPEK